MQSSLHCLILFRKLHIEIIMHSLNTFIHNTTMNQQVKEKVDLALSARSLPKINYMRYLWSLYIRYTVYGIVILLSLKIVGITTLLQLFIWEMLNLGNYLKLLPRWYKIVIQYLLHKNKWWGNIFLRMLFAVIIPNGLQFIQWNICLKSSKMLVFFPQIFRFTLMSSIKYF
jgi:hypothetical protein